MPFAETTPVGVIIVSPQTDRTPGTVAELSADCVCTADAIDSNERDFRIFI